jgi:hypothetical protein
MAVIHHRIAVSFSRFESCVRVVAIEAEAWIPPLGCFDGAEVMSIAFYTSTLRLRTVLQVNILPLWPVFKPPALIMPELDDQGGACVVLVPMDSTGAGGSWGGVRGWRGGGG